MWTKHNSKEGIFYTNEEGVNIQEYGNDVRYAAFKEKLDSGEIVATKFEETALHLEHLNKQATVSEIEWADSEILAINEIIEVLEDTAKDATNQRAYRNLLKIYKNEIYMPNTFRPKLKTGIF